MTEKDSFQELMDLFKTSLNRDEFEVVLTEVVREAASAAYDAGFAEGMKNKPPAPPKSSLILP